MNTLIPKLARTQPPLSPFLETLNQRFSPEEYAFDVGTRLTFIDNITRVKYPLLVSGDGCSV